MHQSGVRRKIPSRGEQFFVFSWYKQPRVKSQVEESTYLPGTTHFIALFRADRKRQNPGFTTTTRRIKINHRSGLTDLYPTLSLISLQSLLLYVISLLYTMSGRLLSIVLAKSSLLHWPISCVSASIAQPFCLFFQFYFNIFRQYLCSAVQAFQIDTRGKARHAQRCSSNFCSE